jgi:hypothetical protein
MSNLYNTFLELLPKKKQMIGKVKSINTSEKTSVVKLLSGGNVVVRGTSVPVDATCLIVDGVVTEELPAQQVYDVTVY